MLMFFIGPSALAGVEECRLALDRYTSAKHDISNSILLYLGCLRANDPQDDCSFEFQMLQFDQQEHELAVLDYQYDCV